MIPPTLIAGMPSFSFTLEEVAKLRLDAVSFFLLVFVLCSFVVRWAWNSLAEVLPVLPAIRFKHALFLMVLSALLLYVVLAMISGARELMTPGAWNRVGSTYELATPKGAPHTWLKPARLEALANLHRELVAYAESHDGAFPTNPEMSRIDRAVWAGIHPEGEPLAYVGWLKTSSNPDRILAYETEDYGDMRNVLLVDGTVIQMRQYELIERLRQELDAAMPTYPDDGAKQ